MRTRRTFLGLALASILIAGGLVAASNMGFRWAPTFTTTGTDYWISLPYKSSMQVANDVCAVVPNASLLSRFDPTSGTRLDWTCPFGTNFPLTDGEGVFLRVTSSSSPVFVGSHDPEVTVPVGGFTVANTDYFISVPYHTTAGVANDLCAEITSASLISRFNTASGIREDWTCPFGNNFTIRLGEAVAVRVSQTGGGFVPAHY
jgi:hypothetical protein